MIQSNCTLIFSRQLRIDYASPGGSARKYDELQAEENASIPLPKNPKVVIGHRIPSYAKNAPLFRSIGRKIPTELATLPAHLLQRWRDDGLDATYQDLIQFWAGILEPRIGKSSEKDCENFAGTIVDMYPSLKDRSPNGTVSITKAIHLLERF